MFIDKKVQTKRCLGRSKCTLIHKVKLKILYDKLMHKVEMPLTKILTASYKEKIVDFFPPLSPPPVYIILITPHYTPFAYCVETVYY